MSNELKNITSQTLRELFKPFYEKYKAEFILSAHNAFKRIAKEYNGDVYKAVNTGYCDMFYAFVSHNIDSFKNSTEFAINENKLERNAGQHAEILVETWALKILAKIGDCETLEAVYFSNSEFNIKGKRAGKEINIIQKVKYNTSCKGRPFLQFPAYIYLDGEKVSAKAFKTTFVIEAKDEQKVINKAIRNLEERHRLQNRSEFILSLKA